MVSRFSVQCYIQVFLIETRNFSFYVYRLVIFMDIDFRIQIIARQNSPGYS